MSTENLGKFYFIAETLLVAKCSKKGLKFDAIVKNFFTWNNTQGHFTSLKSYCNIYCSKSCVRPVITFYIAVTLRYCMYIKMCHKDDSTESSFDLDCVHTMPAHFENGEKRDGSHENGTFFADRFRKR